MAYKVLGKVKLLLSVSGANHSRIATLGAIRSNIEQANSTAKSPRANAALAGASEGALVQPSVSEASCSQRERGGASDAGVAGCMRNNKQLSQQRPISLGVRVD
jgi:hypothetical protein